MPPKDGSVTRSCLSQWFDVSFTVDGVTCRTAEHWMMAEKTRLFGDDAKRREILAAGTPKAAKALGRQVHDFDPDVGRAIVSTSSSRAKPGQVQPEPAVAGVPAVHG